MFLRETKRRLADGSTVAYYQLAENTWNPATRQPETRIVFNCGRVDAEARERLRRLAQSILRRATPEEVVAAAPDLVLEDAWPYRRPLRPGRPLGPAGPAGERRPLGSGGPK